MVICLAGTFERPVRVWGKYSSALLTITSAPGRAATIRLGAVRSANVSRIDHTGGTAGGVSITGSRDVRVERLRITGYHSTGPAFTSSGILVEVRHDAGHASACFLHGDHDCGGIYLLDNTVSRIANRADSMARRGAAAATAASVPTGSPSSPTAMAPQEPFSTSSPKATRSSTLVRARARRSR
jgi:hypothetical protein